MVFIYSVKHFINEKYASKMIAPIPVDLIVVSNSFRFSLLLPPLIAQLKQNGVQDCFRNGSVPLFTLQ